MFKRFLSQGFRLGSYLKSPFLYKDLNYTQWRGFSQYSTNPDLNNELLTKHNKQLKQYHFVKTMMKPPKNIVKISAKDLMDKGLYTYFKAFGQFINHIEVYECANAPNIPGKNTPSGSWIRFKFPFKEDTYIRNQFITLTGGVRIGRLLELLDYLGVSVAYRYAKENIGSTKCIMATAVVDNLEILEKKIEIDKDLYLTGYVCWVGKSSMEIRLDVSHSEDGTDLAASAYFVFVSRDAQSQTKSVPVPELVFDGEEDIEGCKIRLEYGLRNQARRKSLSTQSAFKTPPSYEEGVGLHNLFKDTLTNNYKDKFVPIPETKIQKTMLMHFQDVNMHGKIFGGFIMREATELAWVNSLLHGQGKKSPEFINMDDFIFLNPVEIGSVAIFEAWMTYVEDSYSHVMVTVDTVTANMKTCELHISFAQDQILKPVIPISYFDGMVYLEGKRRLLRTLNV